MFLPPAAAMLLVLKATMERKRGGERLELKHQGDCCPGNFVASSDEMFPGLGKPLVHCQSHDKGDLKALLVLHFCHGGTSSWMFFTIFSSPTLLLLAFE